LYDRKSVRAFTDREITKDEKDAIIRAAMEAPTAGNQMLYTIIDVTDQAIKDRLAVTCDNQPFIAKAKLVLIFFAEHERWCGTYKAAGLEPRKPGMGDILLAVADACIAAQNAVVAAEALGIGSCYIGDILEHCEIHREMFDLPKYAVPAAMLVFGYPTESATKREKPKRFDKKYIVFENKYKTLSPEEHRLMYDDREKASGRDGGDFEEKIKAFWLRKYESDFSVEMTRSANVYMDEFK
jgi:nitroreductase